MRNDTPDDTTVPESATRQPGWRSPDLTEEERAELARIKQRADELTAKARAAEERTAQEWGTAVSLGVLAHWRDSLREAAKRDPGVHRVSLYISDVYEHGLAEARRAQARTRALEQLAGVDGYTRSADR